jgi:CheY-like chemotaxis protein/HPt (histidine-containing phosphotransfer) domain-containing protein
MSAVRVLHVDDEPDIREIVQLSLGLDPDLAVKSCGSGGDALTEAADWAPDLILLDVMMPVMDGPTTLSRLRQSPRTAEIPVVFMTARAQPRELEHFVSLGAEGVISNPFDPMTLAAAVRNYVGGLAAGIAARRAAFLERAREQARALAKERAALADPEEEAAALSRIGAVAHRIAGGSGVFGLPTMSREASALETAVHARLDGSGAPAEVERALVALIATIERA